MERLFADGCARLKLLHEVLLRGDGSGWPWIALLVRHTALNYVRGHAEYRGARAADESRWTALLPLADEVEDQAPVSARAIPAAEAHRILAYADRALRPQQVQALGLWLTDHEYDEIAEELGLEGTRAADRLVDVAIKRLRKWAARGGDASKKIARARSRSASGRCQGQVEVARSAGGSRRREATSMKRKSS
jgi:DNA-directed RNA polymerase specialized sigma24 family protein